MQELEEKVDKIDYYLHNQLKELAKLYEYKLISNYDFNILRKRVAMSDDKDVQNCLKYIEDKF